MLVYIFCDAIARFLFSHRNFHYAVGGAAQTHHVTLHDVLQRRRLFCFNILRLENHDEVVIIFIHGHHVRQKDRRDKSVSLFRQRRVARVVLTRRRIFVHDQDVVAAEALSQNAAIRLFDECRR
ncbi:MAG TPA: hypothetical protein EYO33_02620 [Phycisphaerales bacterium]|nr:hypothetical protein [Phycisphaerales bacterium]